MARLHFGVLIFAWMIFVLLAGCTGSAEKGWIEHTVRRYNDALMKAFGSRDFGDLKEITSDSEYRKVTVFVMSYAGQGERINARMLKLGFTGIDMHDGTADASTSEEWTYQRFSTVTGKAATPERVYRYMMEYNLVKEGSKWKINKVKVVKEEELQTGKRLSSLPGSTILQGASLL